MTAYRPETAAAVDRMKRRFPVKANGIPATWTFTRTDRPLCRPYEPQSRTRGGRRADLVGQCMWAYHAALGDVVTVRTPVRGVYRCYRLNATPAEGRAYLEALASDDPACFLLRPTARQWLAALDKAEHTLGRSLSRPTDA